MNKKAGKIISIYWFAIILIVAAVISYLVLAFHGQPYNIREVEADILSDKIADCISSGGRLNENWKKLDGDNISDICSLNFNVEDYKDWRNSGQYYIEISSYDFDINSEGGFGNKIKTVSNGNYELKGNCFGNIENFPFCLERSFYVLGNDNKKYLIKILSIVKKNEKNIQ